MKYFLRRGIYRGTLRKPLLDHIFTRSEIPVKLNWMRQTVINRIAINYHREIEFQYIKQGHGAYLISGVLCDFQPNSLLIIPSFQVHTLVPKRGALIEKAAVMFSPALVTDSLLLKRLEQLPLGNLLSDQEGTQVEMILRQIQQEQETRGRPFYPEMIRLKLQELIYVILRVRSQPHRGARQTSIAAQMVGYLEEHFHQPLCIQELAARFGYSESHLAHLFKAHVGMGLKQYVLHRRILEAKRLLECEPQLKVQSIAAQVGFASFCLFNRHFQKRTGFKPSAYRRIVHLNRKN